LFFKSRARRENGRDRLSLRAHQSMFDRRMHGNVRYSSEPLSYLAGDRAMHGACPAARNFKYLRSVKVRKAVPRTMVNAIRRMEIREPDKVRT
jgi:hypothetical protein